MWKSSSVKYHFKRHLEFFHKIDDVREIENSLKKAMDANISQSVS